MVPLGLIMKTLLACCALAAVASGCGGTVAVDDLPPGSGGEEGDGFVDLFNGRDLTSFKGLVRNPIHREGLTEEQLATLQQWANEDMHAHWHVQPGGVLYYDGGGYSLATEREDWVDFELWIDWKIAAGGDSGVYLRSCPQVQIWAKPQGSGGLHSHQQTTGPYVVADNPVGSWNTFFIRMVGDRVTVHLNGEVVVEDEVLKNHWYPEQPVFPQGMIELQHEAHPLWFRNIRIREL